MLWENLTQSHLGFTTLNFGESPSEDVESTLWQILEVNVPEAYNLSAKGCLGILNRADRKGRVLASVLRETLERQAGIAKDQTIGHNVDVQIIP